MNAITVRNLNEFFRNPRDDVYVIQEKIHIIRSGRNGSVMQFRELKNAGMRGRYCHFYTLSSPLIRGKMLDAIVEYWKNFTGRYEPEEAERAIYTLSDPRFNDYIRTAYGVQFFFGSIRSYRTFAPWMKSDVHAAYTTKWTNIHFARFIAGAIMDMALGHGGWFVSRIEVLEREMPEDIDYPILEDDFVPSTMTAETLAEIIAPAYEPMATVFPVAVHHGEHKAGILLEDIADAKQFLIRFTFNR